MIHRFGANCLSSPCNCGMYARARENALAISVHRKLSTKGYAKCVTATRHICALPSGVNRHTYPAAIGMNSENIASGTPIKMLVVHGRLPSVVKNTQRTTAIGTQVYLLTRPRYGFRRPAGFIIEASVADLHSSKYRRAHHDQSLLRLVRVARPRVTGRIRVAAKNSLAPRRDIPCFRNAYLDAAKNCICVQDSFGFREVRIAQINFDSSKQRLQLTSAKLPRVQAFLHAAENGALIQSRAGIGVVSIQALSYFSSLQGAPHCKSAGCDQNQRPHFAQRKVCVSQLIQL